MHTRFAAIPGRVVQHATDWIVYLQQSVAQTQLEM